MLLNRICSVLLIYLMLFHTSVGADGGKIDSGLTSVTVKQTDHPTQNQIRDTLTLVNLNIAHGRRTSLNQILVSNEKTKINLRQIADFLNEVDADIVAVQEADGPSWWSGNFDHVAFLANGGKFPQFVHELHAHVWIGHYGTAVLSRLPMRAGYALTFPPSPPTTRKGFTLAEVEWHNGANTVIIDVVSVHLDFSRKSVRKEQLKEIRDTLLKRNHPMIIMGDFNSEWIAGKLTQEHTGDSVSLHTFFDGGKSLGTYKNKRLDWILVSKAFSIDAYEVSPHRLSDHLAVVAKIRLASGSAATQ
jgi:endonuclease/exonuclease/phosphatase family metal-dependent hydrolase